MNMKVSPAVDTSRIDDVYKDPVETHDMPTGKASLEFFGVNSADARRTARWALTSIASAVNRAVNVPARQATPHSAPPVWIPLMPVGEHATDHKPKSDSLAPNAAISSIDLESDGIAPGALLTARQGEQHNVAKKAERNNLLNQLMGFGAAVASRVETASMAVGASALAAGTQVVAKARELRREKSEHDLEQAGARLVASVIALHQEIAHVRKPTANLIERGADKVKSYFQPDASAAQQAAAAAAADVLDFWQGIANVKNPQASSPSSILPPPDDMECANVLGAALRKFTCDELSQIQGALRQGEKTAEVLAGAAELREHKIPALMFMKTVANAAAAEANSRYRDKPLADLVQVGAARSNSRGEANGEADATPSIASALQDENILTRNALEKILRGFHESKADHANETAIHYYARLLRTYCRGIEDPNADPSKKPVLSRYNINPDHPAIKDLRNALSKGNAVNATFEINSNDPMTAQYKRVFEDLRALVADPTVKNGALEPDNASRAEPAVADAKPAHRPGWVRQFGHGLVFWGKYLIGSSNEQASMRVKYLKTRIDIKAGDLQRTLALGTTLDSNKARIESRLRKLHDAVDDLHVELSLQSTNGADEYLQESLLQSMGAYGRTTLKRFKRDLADDSWQPFAEASPPTRLGRLAHRIAQAFSNPFHDPEMYEAEMRSRPPLDQRLKATWATVHRLIDEEPDVRILNAELHQLAAHLVTKTGEKKDYDAIAQAIGTLIKLDAKRDYEHNLMPAALKRLPEQDLKRIARRLHNYSPQSGKDLIGFMNPRRTDSTPVDPKDEWRYRVELAKLHAAVRSLNVRTTPEPELPAETASSAESTPDVTAEAKPLTDQMQPVARLAVAVSKQPVAWAATRLLAQAARSRA